MHTVAPQPKLPRHRKAGQSAVALALLALGLLAGCTTNTPRDTLNPVSDAGDISAWFFHALFWLDVVIFALVAIVWLYAIFKFRKKPGDDTLPEQSFGNMKLEVAWTIVPTLIVIGIAIPTLGGIFELSKKPDMNQDVVTVDVTGKQWWWEFDYQVEGIHTANELHVPADTQIVLRMTSADVIHAWWVPRIAGKRDATPGRTYPLYFRARLPAGHPPDEVAVFDGQCAELCGASHALMGTKIIVHPKAKENSYGEWVKAMQADAKKPATPEEEKGQKLFQEKGCPACHIVKGFAESAARSRTSGPNLTHVGSRMTIAANTLKNTPENLEKWIADTKAVKPGALMIGGSDGKFDLKPGEAKAIATYLYSLK